MRPDSVRTRTVWPSTPGRQRLAFAADAPAAPAATMRTRVAGGKPLARAQVGWPQRRRRPPAGAPARGRRRAAWRVSGAAGAAARSTSALRRWSAASTAPAGSGAAATSAGAEDLDRDRQEDVPARGALGAAQADAACAPQARAGRQVGLHGVAGRQPQARVEPAHAAPARAAPGAAALARGLGANCCTCVGERAVESALRAHGCRRPARSSGAQARPAQDKTLFTASHCRQRSGAAVHRIGRPCAALSRSCFARRAAHNPPQAPLKGRREATGGSP